MFSQETKRKTQKHNNGNNIKLIDKNAFAVPKLHILRYEKNAKTDSNSTKIKLIDNSNNNNKNSELYLHDYNNRELQKR